MSSSTTFNAADGDGYELNMGRWSRRLAVPFLQFVGTADTERILDVGCGTGALEAAVRSAYLDGDPDGPRSYAALAWAVKGKVPLEAR